MSFTCEIGLHKTINKTKAKEASNKSPCFFGFLQDLEEELDMKDRMIRRLQDQVKTLTKTIEKGKGG